MTIWAYAGRGNATVLGQKRLRDYGVVIGKMPPGKGNSLTDVGEVRVGHCTVSEGPVQTGVTAIIPHQGNLFREKPIAATHVINGFGKSVGLPQINELGTLETPILLTNTFSVGVCSEALIQHMLDHNPDIGRETGTVNPVVAECNDGYLNDIRGMHITPEHVRYALASAHRDFHEGSYGAGRGMSAFQLKGGIGTASRQIHLDGSCFHLGVLVLANFGVRENLIVNAKPIGNLIAQAEPRVKEQDEGSIILVVATDLPVSERQLGRICRRAVVGLSRCGSLMGNGSGDVVIAFSTANLIQHAQENAVVHWQVLNENRIDLAFQAVIEASEEGVLNSLVSAEAVAGRDGHVRTSLQQYMHLIGGGDGSGH